MTNIHKGDLVRATIHKGDLVRATRAESNDPEVQVSYQSRVLAVESGRIHLNGWGWFSRDRSEFEVIEAAKPRHVVIKSALDPNGPTIDVYSTVQDGCVYLMVAGVGRTVKVSDLQAAVEECL